MVNRQKDGVSGLKTSESKVPEPKVAESTTTEEQLQKQQFLEGLPEQPADASSASQEWEGHDPAVKIAVAKLLQRPTSHSRRLWSMMSAR
ncbi:MAG: hypothetical protein AAFU53_00595 [Cyanobacteria bacterium J06632_3]